MQDYRRFEPEDLVADPSFQRWKLANDPIERAFWHKWLAQNPDKEDLVEKASYLLHTIKNAYEERSNGKAQISESEVHSELQRLYLALDAPSQRSVNWFQFTPVRYGMAATVVILLGFFGWFLLHPSSTGQMITYRKLIAEVKKPLAEVVNTTAHALVVNLPDKSTIVLYPKSRVSYPRQFAGIKREVYLSGEAFFEVSRNPLNPFYVYANGLVTKVLGTSFLVQTNEATKQVKVVVKTGKVSVYAQGQIPLTNQKEDYKLGGTVLTSNQQIVFSTEATRMVKSSVGDPALLEKSVQKQSFAFKRTPIADVFAALEQAYSIRIIFNEELMKDCYLTASLSDEPLFDKLDLICHTINAHYTHPGGDIIIESEGCN